MAEKSKNSFKTISFVMILTLVGKLLGLLRDRLMTSHYGGGMETNAFMMASQIPRIFLDIVFASAIAASFIPVFSEYMTKKSRREALDFSGNFITVISFLSLILTVLCIVFAGPLVRLIFPGFDTETTSLCISLTRIMLPIIFFTVVAYAFVGILQSFDEFNIPALISVVSNLVIIAYYYTFNSKFGIYGLACAFLIGWFVQAAVQVPSLKKKGFYFKPSLRFNTEGMKKVFSLMLPVMVSTWVQPLNLTINTSFGSHLYNGFGSTAFGLSNNLYLIIIGVFILSITNIIFPRLSRLSALNQSESFQNTVNRTMHASLYFVVPMTAGVFVLARPIVGLIYGAGKFDASSISVTGETLRWMSLGMIGYSLQAILSRAYFAKQNGRVPLVAGILSIGVNVLFCFLLLRPLGITGLAVASAAAATVNAVILILPLHFREGGIITKAFSVDLVKITLSSVVMALVALLLAHVLDGRFSGVLGYAVTAAVPACAGAVLYFILTAVLGVSEARGTISRVRRLFGGRSV